jgi:hypothetical protein
MAWDNLERCRASNNYRHHNEIGMTFSVRRIAIGVVVLALLLGASAWILVLSESWHATTAKNAFEWDPSIRVLMPPRGPTSRKVAVDPVHKWLIAADSANFRVVADFGKGVEITSKPIEPLASPNDCWHDLVVYDGGRQVCVRADNPTKGDYILAFKLPGLEESLRFTRKRLVDAADAGGGAILVEERDIEKQRSVLWRIDSQGKEARLAESDGPVATWALSQDKSLLTVAYQSGRVQTLDARSGAKRHDWVSEKNVWHVTIARKAKCVIAYFRDDPGCEIVAWNLETGSRLWTKSLPTREDHKFHGVVETVDEVVVETAEIDRDGNRTAIVEAWRLTDGALSRKLADTFAIPFVYLEGKEIRVVETWRR